MTLADLYIRLLYLADEISDNSPRLQRQLRHERKFYRGVTHATRLILCDLLHHPATEQLPALRRHYLADTEYRHYHQVHLSAIAAPSLADDDAITQAITWLQVQSKQSQCMRVYDAIVAVLSYLYAKEEHHPHAIS